MVIIRENINVRFIKLDRPGCCKTQLIEIRSNRNNKLLGRIRWSVRVNEYTLEVCEKVHITSCTLQTVLDIINELNTERMIGSL